MRMLNFLNIVAVVFLFAALVEVNLAENTLTGEEYKFIKTNGGKVIYSNTETENFKVNGKPMKAEVYARTGKRSIDSTTFVKNTNGKPEKAQEYYQKNNGMVVGKKLIKNTGVKTMKIEAYDSKNNGRNVGVKYEKSTNRKPMKTNADDGRNERRIGERRRIESTGDVEPYWCAYIEPTKCMDQQISKDCTLKCKEECRQKKQCNNKKGTCKNKCRKNEKEIPSACGIKSNGCKCCTSNNKMKLRPIRPKKKKCKETKQCKKRKGFYVKSKKKCPTDEGLVVIGSYTKNCGYCCAESEDIDFPDVDEEYISTPCYLAGEEYYYYYEDCPDGAVDPVYDNLETGEPL